MLSSGRVLCSCTSHIGQNRLVSKYLTMQDRQTVQKQIDTISILSLILQTTRGVKIITVTAVNNENADGRALFIIIRTQRATSIFILFNAYIVI